MIIMGTPREILAGMLRQARVDAGFGSQGAMAKRMVMARSVVTKAESPNQPVPSAEVLAAWIELTGVEADTVTDLAHRSRSGTPEWFMPYLNAETIATILRCWSPTVVPGLFQIEAYARALIATEPYTPERLTELVATRMERQRVLDRAQVTAVMNAGVVQRCIGSPQIMAEQCSRLVTVAEQPNIALHVMPEARNIGLEGAFDIAENSGTLTVRMTALRDVTGTSPELVEEAMQAFERRLGFAMAPDESIDFVRAQEEQWKAQI